MADDVTSTEVAGSNEGSQGSSEPGTPAGATEPSETSAGQIQLDEPTSSPPHPSTPALSQTPDNFNEVGDIVSIDTSDNSGDGLLVPGSRSPLTPTETASFFPGSAEQTLLEGPESSSLHPSAPIFEQTSSRHVSGSPSQRSISTSALPVYEGSFRQAGRVTGTMNHSRRGLQLLGGIRTHGRTMERRRFPLSELNPLSVPLPLYPGGGGPPGNITPGIPQSFHSWRRNQRRGSANVIRTSMNSPASPMNLPPRRTSSRIPRRSRNTARSSSSSSAEIDRFLLQRSAQISDHGLSPLSAGNASPYSSQSSNCVDHQYHLRFIYVGTATEEAVAGRQVWASLHQDDPFNLAYWVDDPFRPLREVILLSNNPGFRWPDYETVEFNCIRFAPHLQSMSEEQIADWLGRLLRMRYGINDNWFLFQ